MNPPDDPKLERLVHDALRDLPLQRAPRRLEQRVMTEIARRGARPWWNQSFTHWPLMARVLFTTAMLGGLTFALTSGPWTTAGMKTAEIQQAVATQFAWIGALATAGRTLAEFLMNTLRSIPAAWWYGGLALIAALYAALFGLGAAAYRALYLNR